MRLSFLLPAGLLAGLALFVNSAPASAQETGTVKGTFVLKGKAPKVPELVINKDQQACGDAANQKLLVDAGSNGIANVFIWVQKIDEKDVPAELRTPKDPDVVLDQKNCVFIPHCFVARAGQKLKMLNDDPVAHNVRATLLKNGAFNYTVSPNDRTGIEEELDRAELLPQPVQCDIHPWMVAHVLVVDHPYAVVSNEKGDFTIEGLPPGKYDFRVWHEAAGYLHRDLKSVSNVEVKAGAPTDLGKMEVDATKLKI